MHDRYIAPQPFRFLGFGKIRLGLMFVAFLLSCSVLALLAISAVSAHFAYASAKTVPIPPKRPDVMNASPSYIRELMARNNNRFANDNVYDDSFSYEEEHKEFEKDYEVDIISSLQEVDSQDVIEVFENEQQIPDKVDDHGEFIYTSKITKDGIPLPGHKPSYGADSFVQRIEDFSSNPSSVRLAFIEPDVAGRHSDAQLPDEYMLATSPAIRQPIVQPEESDKEKALVSFTLDSAQVSLDPNLREFLLDHAVKLIRDDPKVRLEIHAYASKENEQEYSDVRRSLARALEVRSFLLEQNIEPSRLKITPMGQDADNETDDRIDLFFIHSKK